MMSFPTTYYCIKIFKKKARTRRYGPILHAVQIPISTLLFPFDCYTLTLSPPFCLSFLVIRATLRVL